MQEPLQCIAESAEAPRHREHAIFNLFYSLLDCLLPSCIPAFLIHNLSEDSCPNPSTPN